MTADRQFYLYIGMVIFTFIQAIIKAFFPAFPFFEAATIEWGGVGIISGTKLANDMKEMKTGIAAKKLDLANGCGK